MTTKDIRAQANLDAAAKALREEFEAVKANRKELEAEGRDPFDLHDMWYWRVASVVIGYAYPDTSE